MGKRVGKGFHYVAICEIVLLVSVSFAFAFLMQQDSIVSARTIPVPGGGQAEVQISKQGNEYVVLNNKQYGVRGDNVLNFDAPNTPPKPPITSGAGSGSSAWSFGRDANTKVIISAKNDPVLL